VKRILLVFLFSFTACAWADVVYLNDGSSLKGKVISNDGKTVAIQQVLNAAVTKISRIPLVDVAGIEEEIVDEKKVAAEKTAKAKEDARIKQEKLKDAERQKKKRWAEEKRLKQEQAAREKEQSRQILQAGKQKIEAGRLAEKEQLRQKQEAKVRQGTESLKEKQRLAKEGSARQSVQVESASLVQVKPIIQQNLKYRVINRIDKPFNTRQKMNRTEYTITIPGDYTANDLESVCGQVLEKEIKINQNLDALWVIVYNEKAYRNKGNPRAYAIWAPPNGWDDFSSTADKGAYAWDYRFLGR